MQPDEAGTVKRLMTYDHNNSDSRIAILSLISCISERKTSDLYLVCTSLLGTVQSRMIYSLPQPPGTRPSNSVAMIPCQIYNCAVGDEVGVEFIVMSLNCSQGRGCVIAGCARQGSR